MKRVLNYVQGTLGYGIMFRPFSVLNLEAFSNTDWIGNLEDRRSSSVYCIYIGGNLIQWSSKKQKVVTLSFTVSEYGALSQAAIEIAWLRTLFNELKLEWLGKAVIFV